MTIKNLTIKKGKVVIGGFSEVATVNNTTTDIDNLAQEHKNIIKKLIIIGTNPDLTDINTLNNELPNLVSIELKNMTEVPHSLFDNYQAQNWLESFSAPEAKIIGNWVFQAYQVLLEINLPEATNIGNGVFTDCKALRKLILGGENVTISFANFSVGAGNIDLYLSATEMKSGSVNGNKWTKSGRTWTFKSINQIP